MAMIHGAATVAPCFDWCISQGLVPTLITSGARCPRGFIDVGCGTSVQCCIEAATPPPRVRNENQACFRHCGYKSGMCPGFCGEGACCRAEPHAISLRKSSDMPSCGDGARGCSGMHCCTAPLYKQPSPPTARAHSCVTEERARVQGRLLRAVAVPGGASEAMASESIAAGADVWLQDATGRSPLMYAVLAGNALGVELLLRAGADAHLNASLPREDGLTPLYLAARWNYAAIVGVLLRWGAQIVPPPPGYPALLRFALSWGHEQTVGAILASARHDAHRNATLLALLPNKPFELTPLHTIAQHGGAHAASIVRRLLRHGADPNEHATFRTANGVFIAEAVTPIFVATLHGHAAVLEALLAHGADVAHHGALTLSTHNSAHSLSALHLAVLAADEPARPGERAAALAALCSAGAAFNARDSLGRTPLMTSRREASRAEVFGSGGPAFTRALLALGADVTLTDQHGRTALMYQAEAMHTAKVLPLPAPSHAELPASCCAGCAGVLCPAPLTAVRCRAVCVRPVPNGL